MTNSKNKTKGFNLAKTNTKYGFKTVPNDSVPWRLQSADGKYFGDVSYDAYKAVKDGNLDSYKAKDDSEKKVLDDIKLYLNEQAQAQKKTEKQKRIDSNPVFKRYNIDPADFNQQDFLDWLENNNMKLYDADNQGLHYGSKVEGGFLGFGGKKLATKQQIEDADVLYQLQMNNYRKEQSGEDKGDFWSAVGGSEKGLYFGGLSKLGDWSAKKDYEKAGLDPDSYVSPAQTWQKTYEDNQIANAVGNIAGSLVPLSGVSKAVSVATKGIKWLSTGSKVANIVKPMLDTGLTFAIIGGTEEAISGGDYKDVLKEMGIDFVGGVTGSAAGQLTAKGLTSALTGKLTQKFISRITTDTAAQDALLSLLKNSRGVNAAIAGLTGAAFSTARTVTGVALRNDEQFTGKQLAQDAAIAFLFSSISHWRATKDVSIKNKEYVMSETEKITKEYEQFRKDIVGNLSKEQADVKIDQMRNRLSNLYTFFKDNQFVGSGKEVAAVLHNTGRLLRGPFAIETSNASTGAPTATNVPLTLGSGTTPGETHTPVPPVASSPTTLTATAMPTTGTSSPVAPAAATGELSEVMSADSVTMFTPKSANGEIERLENSLIAKGADDVSRREIVSTALEIEKALIGTDKTIRSVFNNVSKITSNAVAEIKSKAGTSSAYWKLFGENFKAIQSGSVTNNVELVKEYSNAYAEALKNNNPERYNTVIVSADGTDLASELPQTIMQNVIPSNVQNAGAYRLVATQIKNIVNGVDAQISSERTEIYGANSETFAPAAENAEVTSVEEIKNSAPKNITLTQVGDFYEAYGDEAVELANKLNLTLTSKTINGEKVQMVGFPAHVLENYQNALGSNYKLNIADKSGLTKSNVDTAPVLENAKMNTEALSPEDAQKYNIVVSNLKRKAEELGLLDNKFFTALQNVNLYNPTASDRALISSEFHRVFAGNTDPLVANWLDSISAADTQAVMNVTEPTESVTKKDDSVTETPESEKITVGMSDDTRAELLNKKSVNIVSFDAEKAKALDDVDFDALQKTLTRHAKPIIEKVAKDFGILNKTYFNPDIELEFEYSRGSLKESMNKQHTMYGDFAKMLSVFPDVIKNAVGIETHEDKYAATVREDASLKQMYVLVSALSDDTGIIPVKLEVKEFNDKANKLYLSVVLTRKESRYPHGNLEQGSLNTATPTSTVSIADLVGIVNPSEGDFLKYFPDSMLDGEQIKSKNKALAKDAEKVERFTVDKKDDASFKSKSEATNDSSSLGETSSINGISQDSDIVNNSAENDIKTSENVTKEPESAADAEFSEAFRRDENGKIRFNQVDIDYANNKYREESFNVLTQSGNDIEAVKGGIVGKYGVHKKSNGYFGVTLLSSGMDVSAFPTFDEALKFAIYTNETVPFNDISYIINAAGRLAVDATTDFMKYAEQIEAIKNDKVYLQAATYNAETADNNSVDSNDAQDYNEAEGENTGNITDDGEAINLIGRPTEAELKEAIRAALIDGRIIMLTGSDTLSDAMLDYSDTNDVSVGMIRGDITSYYNGVMPQNAYKLDDTSFDDIKSTENIPAGVENSKTGYQFSSASGSTLPQNKTIVKENNVKYSISASENGHETTDVEITQRDIESVQSIGRKSVNDFTDADIKKTERFARKYFAEMGVKSPLFRAWFGDWRENDTTAVKVANKKGAARGITKNIDTGWNIQISGKVFNETNHKAVKNRAGVPYLEYINSIVENAVLLDSYTIPSTKAKSDNSAMMHSLYAIADIGNGREVIKLYVEELNDVNNDGTITRAYQLQNITKQQLRVQSSQNIGSSITSTADTYTVSQLFDIVKAFDKNFNPKPSSKVVNEDGTPKVVYHGTSAEFNTFIHDYIGAHGTAYGKGFYFTDNMSYAEGYAEKDGKVIQVYLDIRKPMSLTEKTITRSDFKKLLTKLSQTPDEDGYYYILSNFADVDSYGQEAAIDEAMRLEYDENDNDADVIFGLCNDAACPLDEYYDIVRNITGCDGIIAEEKGKTIYIALNSNQVKSATDNIGTFNKNNADIRYSAESVSESDRLFSADEAEAEKYAAQVDKWLDGEMRSDEQFELGTTPTVLRELGAGELPVVMSQDVMVKMTGGRHNISLDEIKNIPQAMADPIMVFKSATVKNAYVILTELTDKSGNDVVVALHLDRWHNINKINRVASVYGKNNVAGFISGQIKQGNLKYVDYNKSQEWSVRRGLQLPKLNTILSSNNNILQKDDIVNRYSANNSNKYSNERRANNEQEGNDSLPENVGRNTDASSAVKGKPMFRIGQKALGKRGRQQYVERLDREYDTEKVIKHSIVKAEFINEHAYNDDMREIESDLKALGFKTVGFFVGSGRLAYSPLSSCSAVIFKDSKEIYLRYDDEDYSPRQLAVHEYGHEKYNSKLGRKIKNIIENSIPLAERNAIMQQKRYRLYAEALKDPDLVFEEFVCDVLAGMTDYSYTHFENLMNAFWNQNYAFIDNYKVSEYTDSIDAGGNKAKLDNIGFGNEYSLSSNNFDIPYNEKRQLGDYILRKNHSSDKLKKVDCKEIGNNFYVWENNSKTDYTVIDSIPIVGNEEIINELRSGIVNGTYRRAKSVSEWSANIRSRRRSSTILGSRIERTAADGSNDRLSVRQSESNTGRNSSGSSTDKNLTALDNIGFGNEYSLSEYMPKITLPKQEYALVSRAVMAKNAGLTDSDLKPVDYVYAADEFYVYENHSIGEFAVIRKYNVETEYERIDTLRELINNGVHGNSDRERLNRLIDDVQSGKGSYPRNNGRTENGRYAMADDRISGEQQRSNTVGHSSSAGADNKIRYSAGSYDSDADIRYTTENVDLDSMPVRGEADDIDWDKSVGRIKNDIALVRARAEARKGKVYTREDTETVINSLMYNVQTGLERGFTLPQKSKRPLSVLINRALNAKGDAAVRKQSAVVARYIAQNAVVDDTDGYWNYAEDRDYVLSYMRNAVLFTPDAKKGLISAVGEASAKGYMALFGGGGRSVDAVYSELSAERPDLFPRDISTEYDIMRRIAEVYTFLKDGAERRPEKLIEIMTADDRQTFAALINAQLYEAMSENGRASRLSSELEKAEQKRSADIAKLKAKYGEKVAEVRRNEKRLANERLNKLKLKHSEQKAAERERTRESRERAELLKLARRLSSLKKKATPENRELIEEYIGELDIIAGGITKGNRLRLEALREQFEQTHEYMGGSLQYWREMRERISRLDKMHISEMSIDDVRELTEVLRYVKHKIETENKLISDNRKKEISAAGRAVISEVASNMKKNGRSHLSEKYYLSMLSPMRFFERISGWRKGALYDLAEALNKGEEKANRFKQNASKPFDEFNERHGDIFHRFETEIVEISKLGTEIKLLSNGETEEAACDKIEITRSMRIAIAAHSMSEDNRNHIMNGGLFIPDAKLYAKGKYEAAANSARRIKLSYADMKKIAESMTAEEKELSKLLEQFYNSNSQYSSKTAVNETSLKLNGVEIAHEGWYYPISTNKNFTRCAPESLLRDGTLEGMGMLNARTDNSLPIILSGAVRTLTNHMDSVSKYYGLAPAVRDFMAVYNYAATGNRTSVKDVIERTYGKEANKYIEKLLADLQFPKTKTNEFLSTLRGSYTNAVLVFNPSVTLKQAASLPTAAATLGWDNIAKGLTRGKVDMNLIDRYTSRMWLRRQGMINTELAEARRKKSAVRRRFPQATSFVADWIQRMDVFTVSRLWKAAEAKVLSETNLKEGTDEFYMKTADWFNKAVEETQPNYTVMQRPQILRADSEVVKTFAMFKTQPLQNANIAFQTVGELRRAQFDYKNNQTHRNEAALKSAKKNFALCISALLTATATVAGITVAGALMFGRRDDDDAILEKLEKEFVGNLAGNFLFGAEIYETAASFIMRDKRYDFTVPQLELVNNLINYSTQLINDARDGKDIKADIRNLAKLVGQFTGIPIANVEKYIIGTIGVFSPEFEAKYDNFFYPMSTKYLDKIDNTTEYYDEAFKLVAKGRYGALNDDVTAELERLYKEVHDGVLMPETKSVTVDKVKYTSGDKFEKYASARVKYCNRYTSTLVKTDEYRNASAEMKTKMLQKAYSLSTSFSKYEAYAENLSENKALVYEHKDNAAWVSEWIAENVKSEE